MAVSSKKKLVMLSVSSFIPGVSLPSGSKKSSHSIATRSAKGLSGVCPTFKINSTNSLAQPLSDIAFTKTDCEMLTITG